MNKTLLLTAYFNPQYFEKPSVQLCLAALAIIAIIMFLFNILGVTTGVLHIITNVKFKLWSKDK